MLLSSNINYLHLTFSSGYFETTLRLGHNTAIADTDFCVFAITLRTITRLTLLSVILGGMPSGGYELLLSENKLIPS